MNEIMKKVGTAIEAAIDRLSDSNDIQAIMDNDGGGHFDFGGFRITEKGILELGRVAIEASNEQLIKRNKDLEETVRNLQFEFAKGHSYD